MLLPKPSKKKKVSRPSRDEFELEEIAESLKEAKEGNYDVVLTLWSKDPIQGRITKMDGQTQLIHIERNFDTTKVPFKDILKVSSLSS